MGLFEIYTAAALVYAATPIFLALCRKQSKPLANLDDSPRTFAVIIPAYGEGTCLVENVQAVLAEKVVKPQNIIVVCDHCRHDVEHQLKRLGVTVLSREFEKSTKVKALQESIDRIDFEVDTVVILDADNMVEPGFFEGITLAMADGTQVVQGERKAKNSDTPFAAMDAVSELYNNMVYRWSRTQLGLSSALIGSGFAMDRDLFDELIPKMEAVGGFDKELEIMLVLNKIHIGYTESASVLDEKIREGAAFQNQRRRWIAAQIFYLRTRGVELLKAFFRDGNIDALDRFFQLFFPPRSILLLFWAICLALSLIAGNFVSVLIWATLGTIYGLSLVVVLLRKHADRSLWISLFSVPKFLFRMIVASLKLWGANRTFIHTIHR